MSHKIDEIWLSPEEKQIKAHKIVKELRDINHPLINYYREPAILNGNFPGVTKTVLTEIPVFKWGNETVAVLKEIQAYVTNTGTITEQGDVALAFKVNGKIIGGDINTPDDLSTSNGFRLPFTIRPNVFIDVASEIYVYWINDNASTAQVAIIIHGIVLDKNVKEFYNKFEIINALKELGL